MLYFVAEAYCFGNGVDTDLEKGINYLNQAYNFGNGESGKSAGHLLFEGAWSRKKSESCIRTVRRSCESW